MTYEQTMEILNFITGFLTVSFMLWFLYTAFKEINKGGK